MKSYMNNYEEQENGIQRIKMDNKYGYNRMFEIDPDDVRGNQVYILYSVKQDFPRLERITIPKEKKTMYDRLDPFNMYYTNDFYSSSGIYKKFMIELPELAFTRKASYDRYADVGRAINHSEYELMRSITQYERQMTYNAMSQINAGEFKLRTMLIDWGDAQIMDSANPLSMMNELVAYKRLGLILYPCNELTPYRKEDPYLKW